VTASSVRTSLLVLGAALAVSVGHGQPDPELPVLAGVRPYFTAFPDLKPTQRPAAVKAPNGATRIILSKGDEVALPRLPAIAADATPLRKVQHEQIQEGLAYLARVKEVARLGADDPRDLRAVAVASEVCLLAAEMEETPAKRVPWFEARVRVLKDGEEAVHTYALQGVLSISALNLVRFERLRAEADLLKLKAEVEKAKK
jgi:hypothetical protein